MNSDFSRPNRMVFLLALLNAILGKDLPAATKPAEVFEQNKIWEVHIQMTAADFEAMEPKGGGGMFGGPGGPGGRGGRGGFGPGMFLGPAFMRDGDLDKDGRLTGEEFAKLSDRWFTEWDASKAGKLNGDQLRDGMNKSMAMGPGGPGPGGRGGPGGGMNFVGEQGKRNGLSAMLGTEFNYVRGDLEIDGKVLKNVAVRYKGNGTFMESRGSNKRSLKLDLNEYVEGQKFAGLTTLNLHNCVTDASWMNEVLAYRLYREAGVAAPRSAYARVYFTVPGKYNREYIGLYSMIENPDNTLAEDRFGSKKGAIFKPVGRMLFEDMGDDWSKYQQPYDPKTRLTEAHKRRVLDFCKLVSHASDAEFAAKVGDFLDLDQFARFMAVTTWLSTLDSILGMGQNFLVYLHPQSNRFQFLPWDLDHSFGQFAMMGSQEQREQLSIHQPWHNQVRLLERVFKVEAFKKLYLAKMETFTRTLFVPERFHKQVDELGAVLRPAVEKESRDKLQRFDTAVAGKPVTPAPRPDFGGPGGGPGGGGGFNPFAQPRTPIKGFVAARTKSVSEQLEGKSEGQTVAGMFGGGGRGPGGRGGGPGGPGGGGGFGPGNFNGPLILSAFDADKDSSLTKAEWKTGFSGWFKKWDKEGRGSISEQELQAGLNEDLAPRGGGPGGFGGPGGPGGRPPQ